MNKLIRSTLVLACLSIVLWWRRRACRPPHRFRPAATPSNDDHGHRVAVDERR